MYTRCEMISFVIVRTIQLGRIRCCSLYDVYMFIRIALYTRGTLCPGIDHVWLEHIITKQTVFDIYVCMICACDVRERASAAMRKIVLNDFAQWFLFCIYLEVWYECAPFVTRRRHCSMTMMRCVREQISNSECNESDGNQYKFRLLRYWLRQV